MSCSNTNPRAWWRFNPAKHSNSRTHPDQSSCYRMTSEGDQEWIWNVSCPDYECMSRQGYIQTHPSMSLDITWEPLGWTGSQAKETPALSHTIKTSDDFITHFFSKGWSCWGVNQELWLRFNWKQWGNRPLTPAICPPANISWVWGNTLCWTEVGRALESSDLD